jgi:aspartyl-tRNA(Asn)/glutamyl-tRNA(Gln) amidotransferase subunit C
VANPARTGGAAVPRRVAGRGVQSRPAEPAPEVGSFPSMSSLSRTDVEHLARLARLAVTDEELDLFAGQLDVVLSAVARVGEAAVADVPPTSHVVPLTNVLRADEVTPSLPRDVVLAGAPAAEDDRFRVPRILQEEA